MKKIVILLVLISFSTVAMGNSFNSKTEGGYYEFKGFENFTIGIAYQHTKTDSITIKNDLILSVFVIKNTIQLNFSMNTLNSNKLYLVFKTPSDALAEYERFKRNKVQATTTGE
jgi:hypothetical protein